MCGLKESELKLITELFILYPQIEQAIIFGSRAMGNYKRGSDVDLVLRGKNIGQIAARISGELNEELPLIYDFDVLAYEEITNKDLLERIKRVGKIIYKKT